VDQQRRTRSEQAASGGVPALLGFVVLSELAGLVGLAFNDGGAQRWYDTLDRPWFTPPDWLFGPVWTALYAAMGVAVWLVWRRRTTSPDDRAARRTALVWFFVQLVVNAAWTPLFFGARALTVSAVWIVLLAVLVAVTIRRFWSQHVPAALLLVPYFAWVCFAAVLNATIAATN
jgi:benzodiazapine receptor